MKKLILFVANLRCSLKVEPLSEKHNGNFLKKLSGQFLNFRILSNLFKVIDDLISLMTALLETI